LIARLSPAAAARAGLGDGEMAALVSPRGRLEVRLCCDAALRDDVVVLPKGGWHKHGRNMNVLVEPRFTAGTGAAFNENVVRLERI
jgi:anaerobic selenocysteine-containing dehydrogenase